jgi:hypothetical protein
MKGGGRLAQDKWCLFHNQVTTNVKGRLGDHAASPDLDQASHFRSFTY